MKSEKIDPEIGLNCIVAGKRLNFMLSALQKKEIIGCVLSRLHNHLLKINHKNAFLRMTFIACKTPKNFGFLNWLEKVQKEEFDII